MGTRISATIADQFGRVIGAVEEAIWLFPEERWRQAETAYLRPAGLALHIVESLDFYTSDFPPEQFPWVRLGDWKSTDSAALPTQRQVADHVVVMRARALAWLAGVDDEAWFAPLTVTKWTGQTLLDRVIYGLRHAQHHLGQLNVELRRAGLKVAKWA